VNNNNNSIEKKISNQLDQTLQSLARKNEKAFVPFLTLGDPDTETFIEIVKAIEPYSDVIELGIPFSDPLADGKTIQNANQRALAQGVNLSNCFSLIYEVKKVTRKPIVLLTYANILGLYEEQKQILEKFKDCGVNGIIVADVPVEEIDPYRTAFHSYHIHPVLLATLTTHEERLKKILEKAGGFLYLVAVKGVTGERSRISNDTKRSIQIISNYINERDMLLPVMVGFGISSPDHARQVLANGAKGAIVGSAIIKHIETNLRDKPKMLRDITSLVKGLKSETLPKKAAEKTQEVVEHGV